MKKISKFLILTMLTLLIILLSYNKVFALTADYNVISSSQEVVVDLLDKTYTGNDIEPEVKLRHPYNSDIYLDEYKDKYVYLKEGIDYVVEYYNNKNVGTAKIVIKGIGNYTGTITKTFKINERSLNELNVQVNTSDYRYKATERKASVNIYHNNKKLKINKDYTLTYENHIEVGTAIVTIQGINNYTGTITKYYNIIPQHIKNLKLKVDTSNHTYTGKSRKASVKIYYNDVKLKVNKDYTLEYKNSVKTGTASVTIRGKGNFYGKIKKTYKIVPKKATIKDVIMNSKNTQATITWKKDSQADGYVIYRATSKNGEYKKIKNVSDKNKTSYIVKKLNPEKKYYFKIRSYKMFGNKKAYSKKYSGPKTNSGLLAKITLTASSSTKSRNTNLKVASKSINGLILEPGQTFNWFNVVGKATVEKGYKSATVFVDKKPVPGVGGGICQVSTTLYQAAKKVGLKMVERHTHSLPVTYTTKGNDATVAYGVKNLRIKNNKKYSIKFVTTSDNNKTTCKIYKIND